MEKQQQLPMTNEIASVICAKKCVEDRNFLAEVKANPATQAFGEKTRSIQQVRVAQNTADTLNICVPNYQAMNDGTFDQIADEQMAKVSGGLLFLFMPLIAAAVAAAPAAIGVATASGAFGAAAAGAAGAAAAAGAGVGGAAATGALET